MHMSMEGATAMTSHHDPIPGRCNLYAPMLERHRCHLEAGHEGLHELGNGAKWDDPTYCPKCEGAWDGERGDCAAHGCVSYQRERCVGCKLCRYEVLEPGICSRCERMLCETCERTREGRTLCPTCLLATKAAVRGGRRSGVTEALPVVSVAPNTTSPLDEREEDHGWSEGRGHY